MKLSHYSSALALFLVLGVAFLSSTTPNEAFAEPSTTGASCQMVYKIVNGSDRWGCPTGGCTGTTTCTQTVFPGGIAACTCGAGGPQPWCCHLVVQTGMPDIPVGAGICDIFFCFNPGVCSVAYDETGEPSSGDGEWYALCEL